ncbi:MAG: glycogen synthase GlgA [Magnetospiraceae bacterium]
MKVLFAASEAYPLIKTGGLADVAGALPAALRDLDIDARLIIPAYPQVENFIKITDEPIDLGDPLGAGPTRLLRAVGPDGKVPIFLVDCPTLYDREGGPYVNPKGEDWADNHLRFGLLCRAAATICTSGAIFGWQPDVFHGNDWQTGLTAAHLVQWGGRRTATVFTIHNLHYQGLFDPSVLPAVGLRQESFGLHGVEFHGMVSFLKAGLQYSDRLTTVSPTYAREIQGPAFGRGLDGLLAGRSRELKGVLNGVDYALWDPANDPAIPASYSAKNLAGKKKAKAALRETMGLAPDHDGPVIGIVSRMTEQKGLDLVLAAIPHCLTQGAQVCILGSGDSWLEDGFKFAQEINPGMIGVRIGYDENLAHLMVAGSDCFLVPSRFEPCGLTQLYALRYGTIPLVRRTGGLADTVEDAGTEGSGTGFLFDHATPDDVVWTVGRAVDYFNKPSIWKSLQQRAMAKDFSWQRAAEAYLATYNEIVW